MKHLILVYLILACYGSLIGQDKAAEPKARGYCDSNWCTLPKDDPAHFDPYYNGHLCENFNPKQIDFSKEYLKLERTQAASNVVDDLSAFDLSALWVTGDGEQNGIIGHDYGRIRIHISRARKDAHDKLLYHVKGKSNVKGNICDFSGDIRLVEAYIGDSEYEEAGRLFATYSFREDSTQRHVGTFQGIVDCYYFVNRKTKKGLLDTSSDVADGYHNRTYVGTWKGYKASAPRKCIWGDYRLPFTFDFDCGDGAIIVCDQYAQNGWASFNDGSDFEIVGDKVILKDQWWNRR